MIPFYEPYQLQSYAEAVATQVASGWVGPGKRTQEFEELLAEKTGAKYAVATNSGTSAIMAAIWSIGMEGKRCAFPAYGYPAGANAARVMGCSVRLVDIGTNSGCIRLSEYDGLDTDFAIAIRQNGAEPWLNGYGKPVIDDSAVALGIAGHPVGGCRIFSFSVPKLISMGQGGAVATDREDIAEAVRGFIDQGGGWRETRVHQKIGVNLRMPDILAALGIPQLKRLDELVEMRKQIRAWYRERIDIGPDDAWCVTISVPEAAGLKQWLKERGVQSEMLYRSMNENPCYESRGFTFPVARRMAETTLYLPSSLGLSREDVSSVCDAVSEFREKR